MNQFQNLTHQERIVKLQNELQEIQEIRQEKIKNLGATGNLIQESKYLEELNKKTATLRLILKSITNICYYCDRDSADLDLNDFIDLEPFKNLGGKKAHRDCFKKRWGL